MQKKSRIKKQIFRNISLLGFFLILVTCLFAAYGVADDHGKNKIGFGHTPHHRVPFWGGDNDGNETAGQIAAWLLVVANVPVVMSLLVKFITKYTPLGGQGKDALKRFNRFQKKHLMVLHYYINLVVLIIVTWHWVSSRCKSTALPEWGFLSMALLIGLGVLLKFKWCPPALRKGIYSIHTQPIIFLSILTVLTIGHLMVD